MSEESKTKQRCGLCVHFTASADAQRQSVTHRSGAGNCGCPVPYWFDSLYGRFVFADEGRGCPCYKERSDES